eukprot:6460273-Amphidinium_carterae.1
MGTALVVKSPKQPLSSSQAGCVQVSLQRGSLALSTALHAIPKTFTSLLPVTPQCLWTPLTAHNFYLGR